MQRILIGAAICLALTGFAYPHGAFDWIRIGQYRSKVDKVLCCGENDCNRVKEENVKLTKDGFILSTGEFIPINLAQISEDEFYWRCEKPDKSMRCFFYPPGGV